MILRKSDGFSESGLVAIVIAVSIVSIVSVVSVILTEAGSRISSLFSYPGVISGFDPVDHFDLNFLQKEGVMIYSGPKLQVQKILSPLSSIKLLSVNLLL